MAAVTAPGLPADLEAGLKRLKLRRVRHIAPEVLRTAKTQRWAPTSCCAPWSRPRSPPATRPT